MAESYNICLDVGGTTVLRVARRENEDRAQKHDG